MAGTMEGLGIPIFGGYSACASDGTTNYLTVNADGTHDFTFTGGADNHFSVVITDTAALTTGYMQGFYCKLTSTGAVTAGAQLIGFGIDLDFGGAMSGEVSGFYAYISEHGTTAMTSANIVSGFTAYLAAFGTAADYRASFHAYSAEPGATCAGNLDAVLMASSSGTTGTWGSVIGLMGSTPPEWFIWGATNSFGADTRCIRILDSDESSIKGQIKVYLYDTEYFIPLYATSCS